MDHHSDIHTTIVTGLSSEIKVLKLTRYQLEIYIYQKHDFTQISMIIFPDKTKKDEINSSFTPI